MLAHRQAFHTLPLRQRGFELSGWLFRSRQLVIRIGWLDGENSFSSLIKSP
jgi:hypothetical protein